MRYTMFISIATALLLAGCGGGGGAGGQGGLGLGGAIPGLGGGLGTGGRTSPVGGIPGGTGGAIDGGGGLAGAVAASGAGGSRDGGALTGTGGVVAGGDAAAADGTGGAGGGSDGGTADHPLSEVPLSDSATPDANLHGGASLWIPFNNPATTSTYYFDRCWWFTDTDGYCVLLKNNTSAKGTKTSDLLRTSDGGRTFSLAATIDGGNSAIDGDMDVVALSPTEIWYTTAFVGMGYSGTIGRSLDGGKSFQSLTDIVQQALADPGTSPVPSFPLWHLVRVNGRLWVGSYSSYLASSGDGGTTWQRVAGPPEMAQAEAPELIATRTDLLLRYLESFMISLYRWNGTSFGKIEAAFPPPSGTDHGDTWWRASPFGDGVVFVDRRPYSWWGWPFAVNATLDGGRSFQTILSGQSQSTSDVAGLRDALVVSGSLAYVCGVFLGADQNRYSEIRKSTDGGRTWSVVHSEPETNTYTSVVLDPTGRAHAMRHMTDYYQNEYSYTGHYVLP
jgi:hypothetical protein